MKKLALLLLALCLLVLPGCHAEGGVEAPPVPDTLVIADLDLSGAAAIEIHSGSTGQKQLFTDTDTVSAILEAIRPISGSAPISSHGYYATFYMLSLYDVAEPDANTEPLLRLSLVKPNAHCYVGYGTYETINGFDYPALYEINAAQFAAVDALCMSLMDEVPVYD